jgi:hypothetical protein
LCESCLFKCHIQQWPRVVRAFEMHPKANLWKIDIEFL